VARQFRFTAALDVGAFASGGTAGRGMNDVVAPGTDAVVPLRTTLLYFASCPHWRLARQRLGEAVARAGGGALTIAVRIIITQQEAAHHGLHGSPTILINGMDPFADPGARPGFYCRVFMTEEGPDWAPSVTQLFAALRGACNDRRDQAETRAALMASGSGEGRLAEFSAAPVCRRVVIPAKRAFVRPDLQSRFGWPPPTSMGSHRTNLRHPRHQKAERRRSGA
jgi:hypothetical protein